MAAAGAEFRPIQLNSVPTTRFGRRSLRPTVEPSKLGLKCAQGPGSRPWEAQTLRRPFRRGQHRVSGEGVSPGSHSACTGATGVPPLSSAERPLKQIGPPRSSGDTRPDPQRQKEHLEGNAGSPAASATSINLAAASL